MANQEDNVKLVVYDFDQTISSQHLYHILGGGQLEELSKLTDDELLLIFGGKERITRLNVHLSRVIATAHIAVVSYGYVDVITKALDRMKLFHHFKDALIIGCDSQELKNAQFDKAKVIQNMRKKFNLESNQVLFVDDDSQNIRKAAGTCKTLEIIPREGMSDEHMEKIEILVGIKAHNKNGFQNHDNDENDNTSVNNDHKSQSNDSTDNFAIHNNGNNNGNINHNDNNTNNKTKNKNNNANSWKQKYNLNIPSWFEDKLKENDQQVMITTPVIEIGGDESPNTSDTEGAFVLNAPNLTCLKD